MRVKISARNNFGNSSKADLKFFVPLAVMQTQNSKGRQILGEEIQKSGLQSVQNFSSIGAEMAEWISFFEIPLSPRRNAMRTRYIYRSGNSKNGVVVGNSSTVASRTQTLSTQNSCLKI